MEGLIYFRISKNTATRWPPSEDLLSTWRTGRRLFCIPGIDTIRLEKLIKIANCGGSRILEPFRVVRQKGAFGFHEKLYFQVVKALNNSDESVLAFGANLSMQADSHLVCIQGTKDENTYHTQAINIHSKPRKGASSKFTIRSRFGFLRFGNAPKSILQSNSPKTISNFSDGRQFRRVQRSAESTWTL
ncbi:unnamed protein product, partial [Nesidiocoris tenuis]